MSGLYEGEPEGWGETRQPLGCTVQGKELRVVGITCQLQQKLWAGEPGGHVRFDVLSRYLRGLSLDLISGYKH